MYIKGLHDRDEILDARLAVLEYVQSTGEGKFAANVPLQQGILDQRCGRGCVPYMEVIQQIRFYFSFMLLPMMVTLMDSVSVRSNELDLVFL